MTTQAHAETPVIDYVKLVFSVLFIVSGLLAFYYFAQYALLYRVLALVAVAVVVLYMLLTTEMGCNFRVFLQESKQEVRKVVWPSRQETTQTTLMVFAMVFIVGLILWVLDMILFSGVQLLTGQGG